jgi:hypothetical protein
LSGHLFGEGGIEANGGVSVDDAEAVRTDKGDAIAMGDVAQLRFQAGAFFTRLLEARRDDDSALDTFLPTLLKHLRHQRGADDDDSEVNGFGDVQIVG